MKIGTLTFHRAHNYGGVLQCFALMRFLQLQGYDVEVVDYRCPKIEDAYKIFKAGSLKEIVSSIIHLYGNYRAKNNFSRFRNNYLKLSDRVYNEPRDFSNQYDICIMGSDQVWTLRLVGGFNPIYYGDFSPLIRKIGYAISVAEISRFNDTEQRIMADHLSNFSHFSTREESFCEVLKRISKKEISTVLDPSLLLTKEEYEPIIVQPREKNYVLYYQQEYHPDTKNIIVDVARQTGSKKIVVITGKREKYNYPYKYYDISSLSVPQFLGLIKYANVVFTSSFHGTAYSLVFRKDFYFVANNAPDRAKNLLKKCGAVDRLIHSSDLVKFSKVDYSIVEPLINKERENSIGFLIKAIENKN